jgi:hypothetical protein
LGHKLAVPDELAGKKGRCPECQQRVYIPHPETAASAVVEESADRREFALEGDDPLSPQEGGSVGPGEIATAENAASQPPEADEGRVPPPLPGTPPPMADLPPPAVPWLEAQVHTSEPQGYVPDTGKVQTVYMLAIALTGFTVFAAAPALRHINLLDAPWWARVVLILTAMQLAYIAWMVSLPDWSTVWIGMLVFAVVAAVYGAACGIVVVTPESEAINFLDLDGPPDDPDFRRRVAAWCFVMLLLGTLLTYACGRFAGKWRKQYELAKAARVTR